MQFSSIVYSQFGDQMLIKINSGVSGDASYSVFTLKIFGKENVKLLGPILDKRWSNRKFN